ncbi:pectinesterase [Aureobasidium subglaciale]|nr:pectinesterase [Aureobasidium subglaciale]
MLLTNLIFSFILLSGSTSAAPACKGKHAQIQAPPGALVVDSSTQFFGSFSTVNAAVAALTNSTAEQYIFLMPGTYSEQVYVPKLAGPLTIQGYTCDSRSYADNQATITGNLSRTTPGLTNNDQTATVRLWTANFKLYNLNIANTFGQANTSGQALALSAQNTNQGFYGCRFEGYQDTIYANEGRQVYVNSFINGAVDFIFGLRARAWFEECDIETVGPGFITANGREAANNTSFYVFNQCQVGGTSGVASTVLGRPWRQFSRVVFQRSYLGDVVKSVGWEPWDNVQSVENIYYGEYKNKGPGAVGPRANFSMELNAPVKLETLFGKQYKKEWWIDPRYL